jgi:enamine deaminase RidA (YjgF/YER057c/UK114 family)
MRYTYVVLGTLGLCYAAALLAGGKKKNPDDITQTLALPKDPPAVATGETRHLLFTVSPLSGKGLLTQQTRDALKAILKENGGAPVVHIRAFVAGSGDVRRVPQIVSEVFTDKKLPLPSVSVIRAGGLPVDNAQVVLEAVSVAKKETNSGGVQFVTGQGITDKDPAASSKPLLEKALDQLSAKASKAAALEVTCYVSELARPAELTALISGRFPGATVDLVQTQRLPWQAFAGCEAVTRGGGAPAKLAFTGTRVAFGSQEKDATLAFRKRDLDRRTSSSPTYTRSPGRWPIWFARCARRRPPCRESSSRAWHPSTRVSPWMPSPPSPADLHYLPTTIISKLSGNATGRPAFPSFGAGAGPYSAAGK